MTGVSPTDAAWAAGFIDGEGCIRLDITVRNAFNCMITVAQVDPRPLMKLKEMFGGSLRYNKPCSYHKGIYEYRVSSAMCGKLLEAVRPYLTVKGEQADLVLQFRALVDARGRSTKPLTDAEVVERMNIRNNISDLNQRIVRRGA